MSSQKQFLLQKPPKAPHPPCVKCRRPMSDVRMAGRTRIGSHTKVDCLAICSNDACKAEHKGERIIDLTHGRNRFISQRFGLFSEEMAKLGAEAPAAIATDPKRAETPQKTTMSRPVKLAIATAVAAFATIGALVATYSSHL